MEGRISTRSKKENRAISVELVSLSGGINLSVEDFCLFFLKCLDVLHVSNIRDFGGALRPTKFEEGTL